MLIWSSCLHCKPKSISLQCFLVCSGAAILFALTKNILRESFIFFSYLFYHFTSFLSKIPFCFVLWVVVIFVDWVIVVDGVLCDRNSCCSFSGPCNHLVLALVLDLVFFFILLLCCICCFETCFLFCLFFTRDPHFEFWNPKAFLWPGGGFGWFGYSSLVGGLLVLLLFFLLLVFWLRFWMYLRWDRTIFNFKNLTKTKRWELIGCPPTTRVTKIVFNGYLKSRHLGMLDALILFVSVRAL